MSILLAVPFASERLSQTPQSLSSSQSTGLSEYEKCRLEYIGRRNLNVGRMSAQQKFEMEAALSADYPYGCGGLRK
jgi:hypothetical protein